MSTSTVTEFLVFERRPKSHDLQEALNALASDLLHENAEIVSVQFAVDSDHYYSALVMISRTIPSYEVTSRKMARMFPVEKSR